MCPSQRSSDWPNPRSLPFSLFTPCSERMESGLRRADRGQATSTLGALTPDALCGVLLNYFGAKFDRRNIFPYIFPMQATLTSKGEITIPVKIRRMLRLNVGDRLNFDETAPFLKATKAVDPDAWDNFRAIWKNPYAGMSTGKALEEIRGPVELPPGGGSSGQ